MPTFERILFPVDFSTRCNQTACLAVQFARKFSSELHLLHVIDEMPMIYTSPEAPVLNIDVYQKAVEEQNRADLEAFGEGMFAGVRVVRDVRAGDPAKVIVDYATGNGIGLIVLPTHGRGVFRRMLMGSVTAKVLHDCACPVLTTAHAETLGASLGPLQKILCAIDLDAGHESEDVRLISEASDLARSLGATVQLLYALPAFQPTPEFPVDPELKAELEEEAGKRIEALQAQTGNHWEVCVRSGDPAVVIHDAAMDFKASLVVVGRGRITHRFGQLRTHVTSIIRESPCPVLSIAGAV